MYKKGRLPVRADELLRTCITGYATAAITTQQYRSGLADTTGEIPAQRYYGYAVLAQKSKSKKNNECGLVYLACLRYNLWKNRESGEEGFSYHYTYTGMFVQPCVQTFNTI